MQDRRHTTAEQYYLDKIAALENRVTALSIDLAYGCLTRAGLQIALQNIDASDMWVCYFDLDKFKELNTQLGKERVNEIVAKCIKPRGYDILGTAKRGLVGRWFSGDELAGLFNRNDVLGYCNRVQAALRAHGTSGTFLILPALYKSTSIKTIDYAEKIVSAIKAKNHRNLIAQIGA